MKKLVLTLTLARMALAPLILLACIFFENYWLAFFLFNIAALTDYFDGKIARYYGVESRLGAILDPIADKILLVFIIISITTFAQNIIVTLLSAFILAREFWVSAIRELASSSNQSAATQVTFIAKTKTATQFIALSMYLLGEATNFAIISFLANFVLLLAALLAYQSAIHYTQKLFNSKQRL